MNRRDKERNKREYMMGKEERENPIADLFQEQVGPLLKLPPILLGDKKPVAVHGCEVKGSLYKVIFTTGILLRQPVELVICLPKEWPVRRYDKAYYLAESFPVDLLREIVKKVDKKDAVFSLKDGVVIDRKKAPWNRLAWSHSLNGAVLVEHQWGEPDSDDQESSEADEEEEETISLLTLFPVMSNEELPGKKELAKWLETRRNAGWETAAFPYDPSIDLQRRLQDAIDRHEAGEAEKAVKDGAVVNYPYMEEHPSFGFYSEQTLLENALGDRANEEIIRYLADQGAKVPRNGLARMIDWGHIDIYRFLLEKGAEVDVTFVGMSALERAKAFDNKEGYQALLELGAKPRGKK